MIYACNMSNAIPEGLTQYGMFDAVHSEISVFSRTLWFYSFRGAKTSEQQYKSGATINRRPREAVLTNHAKSTSENEITTDKWRSDVDSKDWFSIEVGGLTKLVQQQKTTNTLKTSYAVVINANERIHFAVCRLIGQYIHNFFCYYTMNWLQVFFFHNCRTSVAFNQKRIIDWMQHVHFSYATHP